MMATLTSKGQLTIPKQIRDKLAMQAGDKVLFALGHDRVVKMIAVNQPMSALEGMLPKPAKAVSLEEMDSAIEEEAGRL